MVGGEVGELDRASDGQVGAALLVLHLHDGAALAQRRVVSNFLHAQHRGARDPVLAQDVDGLVLGLVRQPLLGLGEDVEDVRLAGLGGGVSGVVFPFGLADGLAGGAPVLWLDGEVDVGVGVVLPALALQDPARVAAAAGVAAAGHGVGEGAVGVLRVLLQVAQALQAQLVAQLNPAQVQHRILHRDRDLLAAAGLLPAEQRGQDADRQVYAGVAVAHGGTADGGRPVPEAGRRAGAAWATLS